jgi:hypothetical protein
MKSNGSKMNSSVLMRVLAASLAALLAGVTLTMGSNAVGADDTMNVAVTGSFAGAPSQAFLIAGVATAAASAPPFTFSATCTTSSGAACPAGTAYDWDVSSGSIVSGSGSSTVVVAFPEVGMHQVSVDVFAPSTTMASNAFMTAAVSVPLAEFSSLSYSQPAANAWAAVASGTLPVCGADPVTGVARWCAQPETELVANAPLQPAANPTLSPAAADPTCTDFATGGTITQVTDGGTSYCVHSFTSVGGANFNVVKTDGLDVEYLVVAGGGGGGRSDRGGGGGGAGGLLTNLGGTKQPLNTGTPYAVTVGGGGSAGGSSQTQGTSGSNSAFSTFATANGGGGGGREGTTVNSGGSGGGGGHNTTSGGTGTSGQGNNGGRGIDNGTSEFSGGGGGGAGGAGNNGSGSSAGGVGLANSITGTATYYAGGGGGGRQTGNASAVGTVAAGGLGGGGGSAAASPGAVNTGGGGGGGTGSSAGNISAGAGGSGIVVIRYAIPAPVVPVTPDVPDGSQGAVIGDSVGNYVVSNGIVTGQLCVNNPAACGTNPVLASVVQGGSADGVCTTQQCLQDLVTAKLVTPQGLHAFVPGSCQDNLVSRPRGSTQQTVRGAETGCLTAEDIAHAVLALAPAGVVAPAPPVAPMVNLVPSIYPTDDGSWNLTGPNVVYASNSGPDMAPGINFNYPVSVNTATIAFPAVPGQTYTASVFARTVNENSPQYVTLELTGRDADGQWLGTQKLGPNAQVEIRLKTTFTKISITGTAVSKDAGLRVKVPAGSSKVQISLATMTPGLSPYEDNVQVVCPVGPQPTQSVIDADALYPALGLCNSDRAITSREAAQFLSWMSSLAGSAYTSLETEFVDVNPAQASALSSLLPLGSAPANGLRCSDVNQTQNANALCLNPDRALTRTEFASMLYPLLASGASAPQVATLSLLPLPSTVGGAQGTPVRVSLNVPASLASGTRVSLTPTGMLCPVTTLITDSSHTASSVCFVPVGSAPGTVSVSVIAAIEGGSSVSASTAVQITSTAPLVPSLYLPSQEKDSAATFPAFSVDIDGQATTLTVRSCAPASEECLTTGNFPQTGESRTTAFGTSAQTEIGTVSVGEVVKGRANLVFTGYTDSAATPAGMYVNGDWQFVLRSCDASASCTSRLITNFRTPVADPPVASPQTVSTSVPAAKTFTLSGADANDVNRHLNTSLTVETLSWTSLPAAGLLEVSSSGNWSAVTQNASYPLGSQFRWTPAASGTTSASFTVKESTAQGLTSPPATVTFTAS